MNKRTSSSTRLVRSESGVALVEFALLAPVMVLLLLGIIDFGRYMYDGILAANAARAGTDYGSYNSINAADIAGMENAAYADAQNLSGMTATASYLCLGSSGASVTCGSAGSTTYVEVKTTGKFSPLVSYPLLPPSVTVNGLSIMRVVAQ